MIQPQKLMGSISSQAWLDACGLKDEAHWTMKHGATSFPMEILIDVITGVLNNDDKMMTYVFLDVIRSY